MLDESKSYQNDRLNEAALATGISLALERSPRYKYRLERCLVDRFTGYRERNEASFKLLCETGHIRVAARSIAFFLGKKVHGPHSLVQPPCA
jgi:hypothetical protein